jgi:hypothetical protein
MVEGNQDGAITVFSFSIKRTGKAEKKLSDFLLKMSGLEEDDIIFLSGFSRGQRFNLFCASRNADTLRQFLRSQELHAKELESFMQIASLRQVLRTAHHDVLAGAEIRTFGVFAFDTTESAAMYYVKNAPAPRNG